MFSWATLVPIFMHYLHQLTGDTRTNCIVQCAHSPQPSPQNQRRSTQPDACVREHQHPCKRRTSHSGVAGSCHLLSDASTVTPTHTPWPVGPPHVPAAPTYANMREMCAAACTRLPRARMRTPPRIDSQVVVTDVTPGSTADKTRGAPPAWPAPPWCQPGAGACCPGALRWQPSHLAAPSPRAA